MPRYKFHFTDGKSIVPDDGGMNLRNDQAAIGEAYHIARDLRDAPPATRSFFFGVRRLFGTIQAQPVSAFVPNCPGRQQGATRGTGTVRAGDGRRQSSSRP